MNTKTAPHPSTGTGSPDTTAINAKTYLSLKKGKANKTGQRSHGQIHYRLLTDAGMQALYVIITGNDGGGYHSKEIVPFVNVEQCLEGFNTDKPLSSKLFQPAFVGQSTNNAGFLAAILRAENLLAAVPESPHHHALQADWDGWKASTLALADKAEPFQPELPKPRITKSTVNPIESQRPEADSEATGDENPTAPDDADMIQPQTSSQGGVGAEPSGIAGESDKSKAKKQRAEKRQHPGGEDSQHDSPA
ncbi:hypothetical protein [Methylovulum psychrotolerans]|uniref:Uncharacterized protein n=1 Tax=Methylovulum psychrotolerans TaxID=1704499 RepID=A0A1Z4C4E7_9GAMM|nr:hypothetical protein [Methylovulum psychrotolerans]ASF48403.1 hypothetical protein CEK71_21360 [Methylovulum psychrotolerans]